MSLTHITVRGAREHNLKGFDIALPRDKLIVITGLSGSGKSSLAFDTIYAEGQRRYVESLSAYARQFLEMMQKPDVEHIDGLSPAISIEQKTTSRNPRSTVATVTEIYDYMRLLWARVGVPYSPATGLPISAQTVSQMVDRVMALPEGTRAYLLAPVVRGRKGEYRKEIAEWQRSGYTRLRVDGEFYAIEEVPALDKKFKHDIEVVVDRIVVKASVDGEGGIETRLADSFEQALKLAEGVAFVDLADGPLAGGVTIVPGREDEAAAASVGGKLKGSQLKGAGVPANRIVFSEKFACPVSGFTIESIEPRLFSFNAPQGACPACDGLGEKLLFDEQLVVPNEALSLKQGAVVPWAKSNPPSPYYMQVLASLAAAYGFSLETLKRLRDLGNTVIVVEHDEDAIRHADHIVDLGPGAGVHGGEVVAEGTLADILACEASLTGQYLTGARRIEVPAVRRAGNGKQIVVENARANNLRGVTASFPLGMFVCVSGLSGSGKSTLTIDTLQAGASRVLNGARVIAGAHDRITGLEWCDKVIEIDQSPIGRTPRSNPATYTGAFTLIRDWFAGLPESLARGYKPGRFSFNVKGGRCEKCQGDGLIKIEMHFLPDVYVTCEECGGRRYNRETLEVKFRGMSIADVLDMTIEDAEEFFKAVPPIRDRMHMLNEVGLGYVKVGQQATTLSGGEAQRVKLAKELARRSTGQTLYILDEPTTGLHFEDVRKLLEVLHRLVDQGNSVVVIEHNLDVIKTADWVIDLGPEGGVRGGLIVAEGTPEAVAANAASFTGGYLQGLLGR